MQVLLLHISLYLLQSTVTILAILLLNLDPWNAPPIAILVGAVYWIVFLRADPRITGMVLIALILATYYQPGLSRYAVLFVVAAGLGGGIGAYLTQRGSPEDDFFFLPLGGGLLAFIFLIWLGEGFRVSEPVRVAAAWLEHQKILGSRDIERLAQDEVGLRTRDIWAAVQPYFGPWVLFMMLLLTTPGLWLAGRFARWATQRLDRRRAALILFRIDQRYIFLLICPLALWILGILTGSEKQTAYVVWPLLTVFGIACLVEGLAVVLFHLALRRTISTALVYRLSLALFLGAIILLPAPMFVILTMLGLADIWFDLRRIRLIQDRLNMQ